MGRTEYRKASVIEPRSVEELICKISSSAKKPGYEYAFTGMACVSLVFLNTCKDKICIIIYSFNIKTSR